MGSLDLFVVALLFDEHDVPTILGTEGFAYFAQFGVIHGFLEGIDISERCDPSQFTSGLLHGRVGTQLTRYGVESLYGLTNEFGFLTFAFEHLFTEHNALVCLVDFGECVSLLCAVCAHGTLDSDVGGTAVFGQVTPAHLDKAVHRLLVLQVLRRSLCAITLQFLFESLGGVDALCFGFGHFEFEVDKHVEVLVHGLGVDSTGLVVFFIDVQKLLGTNGFAVNGHQGLLLRKRHCAHERSGKK